MSIIAGLTYAPMIGGGYKQSCSVGPGGVIMNPYTDYADWKCTMPRVAFPNNTFAPGCQPWANAGVDASFGNPSWFFKPSCY